MTRLWAEGQPITVSTDVQNRPKSFVWDGRRHQVRTTVSSWRVDVEWWQGHRVWRDYFQLTTATGLLVTIFYDLQADGWYLQQLYD